jgi:hypothetical protein
VLLVLVLALTVGPWGMSVEVAVRQGQTGVLCLPLVFVVPLVLLAMQWWRAQVKEKGVVVPLRTTPALPSMALATPPPAPKP